MNLLVFTLHFWLKIMIKMIINIIAQIRDKTTNVTQDQTEFEK